MTWLAVFLYFNRKKELKIWVKSPVFFEKLQCSAFVIFVCLVYGIFHIIVMLYNRNYYL